MLLGIQILGLLFVAVMIYFTYLNYKRHNYGSKSLIAWLTIWVVAGIIIIIPGTLYGIMEYLNIDRTQDLLYTGAFIILFVTVFNMYITIKKTHAKVEALVRKEAIQKPLRKTKTKKG